MQNPITAVRRSVVLAMLAFALIVPSAVFADDGEIGDMNDTDSITDVYVSDGRPAVQLTTCAIARPPA
jgi:hypothetical protein